MFKEKEAYKIIWTRQLVGVQWLEADQVMIYKLFSY